MYFHSATSRRDHYATLRNQHQIFKQQQIQQLQRRSSTSSSIISGTDSAYQSSPVSPLSLHAKNDQHYYGTKQDQQDNASTTSSFVTNSTTSTKKKVRPTKKYLDHHPRQPDLVYLFPRPLAFPFHNDDHFLPVAEADPRDIARIAPPPPPTSSKRIPNNSKTTSITTSSYHRTSISSIPEDDTISHTTNHNYPGSLVSSVQQGTVRSLRSFFQMGDQPQQQQAYRPIETNRHLSALEPKIGTVASLRKLFSRPTNTHHADREAETTIHTSKNSQSGNSIKAHSFGKMHASQQQKPQAPTPPPPSHRFTLSRLWPSKKTTRIIDHLPKPPSTPPKANKTELPSPTSSLSTGLKRIFTRQTSRTMGSSATTATDTPTSPPRSFFASFSRASRKGIDSKTPPKKQHATTVTDTLDTPPPPSPPTAVRRIWKNFKRLVNGNKASKIGVL